VNPRFHKNVLILASILVATTLVGCAREGQKSLKPISEKTIAKAEDSPPSKDTLEEIDTYFAACNTGALDQGLEPDCLKLGGFPAWYGALKRAGAKDDNRGCVDDDGVSVCVGEAFLHGKPDRISPIAGSVLSDDSNYGDHHRLDAYFQHVDRERRTDSKKACSPDVLVRVRLDETGRLDSYYADCGKTDKPNAVFRSITMATPNS
jgi:hypothetical protein